MKTLHACFNIMSLAPTEVSIFKAKVNLRMRYPKSDQIYISGNRDIPRCYGNSGHDMVLLNQGHFFSFYGARDQTQVFMQPSTFSSIPQSKRTFPLSLFSFEMGLSVWPGVGLITLLPQLLKCWYYRCKPPPPAISKAFLMIYKSKDLPCMPLQHSLTCSSWPQRLTSPGEPTRKATYQPRIMVHRNSSRKRI